MPKQVWHGGIIIYRGCLNFLLKKILNSLNRKYVIKVLAAYEELEVFGNE